MTVTHSSLTRDALVNAAVARIDLGSAIANGRLQLASDSGFTDIIVFMNLANPAFTVATGGAGNSSLVIGSGISATYVGATKTANYFRFVNRDGVEVFRGTVSGPTGSGDMRLADNVILTGTVINVVSYVYTTIL